MNLKYKLVIWNHKSKSEHEWALLINTLDKILDKPADHIIRELKSVEDKEEFVIPFADMLPKRQANKVMKECKKLGWSVMMETVRLWTEREIIKWEKEQNRIR